MNRFGKIIVMLAAMGFSVTGQLVGNDGRGATEVNLNRIRDELRGPVQIQLEGGRPQVGRIDSFVNNELSIAVSIAGGEAILTFPAEQIQRIEFPGREHLSTLRDWMDTPGREQDALALFRAFYEQQDRFFDIMEESALNVFVEYARFALSVDDPILGITIAERLYPKVENEATRASLDNVILLGYLRSGLIDEALEWARSWIATADPAGETALGWRALAEIHFRNEDYERALWAALHPVAYAGVLGMEHLDVCYALAIASFSELKRGEDAMALYREMLARNLAWPTEIGFLTAYEPRLPEASGLTPDDEGSLGPIEDPLPLTPSPKDPMESLPTRILF